VKPHSPSLPKGVPRPLRQRAGVACVLRPTPAGHRLWPADV